MLINKLYINMSETLKICGLTVDRGEKLSTMLPVPDTAVKIPLTNNNKWL